MLTLPAELTHAQAGACVGTLMAQLAAQSGPAVQLNAGSLERFDSSALAVLLECRRAAAAAGKSFVVSAMPARLRALARLYGVSELLPDMA